MLTKVEVVDKIEILEAGHIQVRRATYIEEDGVRIAGPTFHRSVYAPGDEIPKDLGDIQRISEVVWTEEKVSAYRTQRDEANAALVAASASAESV